MKFSVHPLAELPDDAGKSTPTDQQLVLRLRVSLAKLLSKGDGLTQTFYTLLFERHPMLRPLFPADMEMQRSKLAQTLVWIVTHLDRRESVLPAVRTLGKRHAGHGARAEHYPLVRDALIDAMARTAGPDWSPGLAEDWRLSIDLIARHMMAGAAGATLSVPAAAAPHRPATSIIQR